MHKVNKAVILAGGRGTRFLPYTKTVPKEMLALVDTPVIQLIVNEILDSGINNILVISSKNKKAMEHYFTDDNELEDFLLERGKTEEYKVLKAINGGNISFVEQKVAGGTGQAVLLARSFTAGEPFVVLNGDDYITNVGGKAVTRQLCDAYENVKAPIIGVQEVSPEIITKCGSIVVESSDRKLHKMSGVIEKPKKGEEKSLLACLGRYLFTDDIYGYINKINTRNGELCLTDAIDLLAKEKDCYAYDFDGKRYDMGSKLGYAVAGVEHALSHPETAREFIEYIKTLKLST